MAAGCVAEALCMIHIENYESRWLPSDCQGRRHELKSGGLDIERAPGAQADRKF